MPGQASLLHPCLGSVFDKLHSSVIHHHRSFLETEVLASSWGGGHKKSKAITAGDAASYAT